MSHPSSNSGPRANAYSESKFTNWTPYDPFFAEGKTVAARYQSRIPKEPRFPHVVAIKPSTPDFIHPCSRQDILRRLETVPKECISGLRAIFLLGGTRKQEKSWNSSLGTYGYYWRNAVFLCAHPFNLGRFNLDSLRTFFLDDVLMHEIAHHLDRHRSADNATKEGFAHAFTQRKKR
jgi:hypothetical protein